MRPGAIAVDEGKPAAVGVPPAIVAVYAPGRTADAGVRATLAFCAKVLCWTPIS